MGQVKKYKDGKVGGVLVGREHKDGGIKIKNIDTGELLEAENDEVIIMADAVRSPKLHEFNGKKMTNRQILSAINESAGGVSLLARGGEIGNHVSCGCTGKKHRYNGEELTDREILKRMAEGGNVGNREIRSARDFDKLLPEEIFVLEVYRSHKPAFRKQVIARAFDKDGYPHHEHLEKAEQIIDQLKKFGFITPQNALSPAGKEAIEKAKEKWAMGRFPHIPTDKESYEKWWLPYFRQEGRTMAQGGNVSPLQSQADRAKAADLVILPENVQGTNCSNCQFVQLIDEKEGKGYCKHPKVDQPVTARMCCIYWDAPGTRRIWEQRVVQPSKYATGGELQEWYDKRRFYYREAKPGLTNVPGQSVIVEPGDIVFLSDEFDQTTDDQDGVIWMMNPDNFYYVDRLIVKGDTDIAVLRNEATGKSHYKDLQEINVLFPSEQKVFYDDEKFLDQIFGKGNRFAKGGKVKDSSTGKSLKLSDIPDIVKTFMPLMQQKAIVGSMEYWDVIERLKKIITEMPKTYETEDIPSDKKMVYLHYFYGQSDWYIVEKDMEPDQLQAFGYVILNGDLENAEWGYISIEEIKDTNRIELDFYFDPIEFGELKKKWQPQVLIPAGTRMVLKKEYGRNKPGTIVEVAYDHYSGEDEVSVRCCEGEYVKQRIDVYPEDLAPVDQEPKPDEPGAQEPTFGTGADTDLVKFPGDGSVDRYLKEAGLTQYMGIYEEGNEKMPEGMYAINPQTKKYLTWGEYEAALANTQTRPQTGINAQIAERAQSMGFNPGQILVVSPSRGEVPKEAEPQHVPQASTKTAKQQAAINAQISALIKSKGINSSAYSAAEIALLKQYSGAGGLSKHGASGPRILDQFFTPMDICAKMWGLALEHGFNFNKTNILEPAVGTGNFLQFIPGDANVQVVAHEVDEITYGICKILFPQYDIRHSSFESQFFNGRRHVGLAGVTMFFDLVIGNPPYREYVSEYAPLGEKDATGAFTFEMYFIMRGIDVLKPGGLLIYVIPNTFMSNDSKYNPFKEALAKKADLVDAYRLPNGIFDFTEVGTDIIVLRKKKLMDKGGKIHPGFGPITPKYKKGDKFRDIESVGGKRIVEIDTVEVDTLGRFVNAGEEGRCIHYKFKSDDHYWDQIYDNEDGLLRMIEDGDLVPVTDKK